MLPGDPLVDGETALRPGATPISSRSWSPARTPRSRAGPASPYLRQADARAYLLQRHDSLHAGIAAPFAIVSAADRDQLLGSISLMRFAWQHARAEVGYWLARDARGHGHATRAVRLITAWGFRSLGLERIDLLAATGNPASQRVAERCGFTREAVLRSYLRGKDGPPGHGGVRAAGQGSQILTTTRRLGSVVRCRSSHSQTATAA